MPELARRPLAPSALVLAVLVAGCSMAGCSSEGGGTEGGGDLARRLPSTTEERSSSTSRPPTTRSLTTTASPATTTPAPAAVVPGPHGLGIVDFGTPAPVALAELVAHLGPPNDDRPLGSCPSGEVDRLVQFAELTVLVASRDGTERFVAWDLGASSGTRPPLATAEGVTVGSSLATLRSAYGERLELSEDDPFGPGFEIRVDPPGRLGGTLTGTSADDTVATLSGGVASCA